MRKILIAFCFFCAIQAYSQTDDPILFSIGDDEVRQSEFQYIYEKNNADKADYSKASIDEYLELYKKFKLKVHRARELGMDTIPSLQKELEGYRKQLASSYLKDKEISDRLIDEVLIRMKEDREVSHIFVNADPKANAEKIKASEEKINNIYTTLLSNGGATFNQIARTISEDKISAKKEGKLGYYTSPLPDGFYEFENAMYNTPSGSFSKPIRSKMGFHILKVSDIRPARGEMEIAHILIRLKDKGKKNPDSRLMIDSICSELKKGVSFEYLASNYSMDNKTRDRGGYLGFFGVNQYERSFEDAAFALEKDGDYTIKPIVTKVGYHVIKRISKRNYKDIERTRKRIEARINNNDRFKVAEEKLIQDVKNEAGFKENRSHLVNLTKTLDNQFYSYKWSAKEFAGSDKEIFNIGKKKYTVMDLANYAKNNVRTRLKFPKKKPFEEAVNEIYDQYVEEEVMAYEEANLERKYGDFRALMREYREGILLFEITKNEVWDKASQDSVGLQQYYDNNKNKYMWPDRVTVDKISLTSSNFKDAQKAHNYAKKKGLKKFLSKYGDNDKVQISQSEEVLDAYLIKDMELKKKDGDISALQDEEGKKVFYVFKSYQVMSFKTLKEARGYVIADYQDHLEKIWVDELKSAYPIKVNQANLKALVK